MASTTSAGSPTSTTRKATTFPALRERVLSDEKVSLVNAEAEEKHDNYWGEMYQHVIEGFQAYPEFLPLVYISYYYFHNEIVSHMDPNYTRANYVLDVREKSSR
ncbi:MAG: hypothetical protein ACLUB2_02120 [Butyricicoccus pullicaecorum]